MTPDNFLALEPLIIARLREVLPPHVHVLSAADLGKVTEATQPTPAVHVLYRNFKPLDPASSVLKGEQRWLTVIAVRNLTDIDSGEAARQEGGLLAAKVLDAMFWFTPDLTGAGRLQPVAPPDAGFSAGHFYLPLAWAAFVEFWRDTCPTP